MNTLMLVDGNHTAARAYFKYNLSTNGYPTGVVYGVINILKGLCNAWRPDELIVLWDIGKSSYRCNLYEGYKKRPSLLGDDFRIQLEMLQKTLDRIGIVQLGIQGVEADDLFGLIINDEKIINNYEKTMIISSDHDLYQLIEGCKVIQYDPIKHKVFDEIALKRTEGLTPAQIIDFKALAGDSSDKIPGISGIGKKTALDLLKKYGSISKFDADELNKKKSTQKIISNWDEVLMFIDLITIFTNKEKMDDFQKRVYDDWRDWYLEKRDFLRTKKESLHEIFKTLDFKWSESIENFLREFGKVIRR